jgi:hypothetical protein
MKRILQADVTKEILKLYIHMIASRKSVTFFKEIQICTLISWCYNVILKFRELRGAPRTFCAL